MHLTEIQGSIDVNVIAHRFHDATSMTMVVTAVPTIGCLGHINRIGKTGTKLIPSRVCRCQNVLHFVFPISIYSRISSSTIVFRKPTVEIILPRGLDGGFPRHQINGKTSDFVPVNPTWFVGNHFMFLNKLINERLHKTSHIIFGHAAAFLNFVGGSDQIDGLIGPLSVA